MENPKEFNELCSNFHQDIFQVYPSLSAAITDGISSLGQDKSMVVREYLERLLNTPNPRDRLEEAWSASPAQIGFKEANGLEVLFKQIMSAIDERYSFKKKS